MGLWGSVRSWWSEAKESGSVLKVAAVAGAVVVTAVAVGVVAGSVGVAAGVIVGAGALLMLTATPAHAAPGPLPTDRRFGGVVVGAAIGAAAVGAATVNSPGTSADTSPNMTPPPRIIVTVPAERVNPTVDRVTPPAITVRPRVTPTPTITPNRTGGTSDVSAPADRSTRRDAPATHVDPQPDHRRTDGLTLPSVNRHPGAVGQQDGEKQVKLPFWKRIWVWFKSKWDALWSKDEPKVHVSVKAPATPAAPAGTVAPRDPSASVGIIGGMHTGN